MLALMIRYPSKIAKKSDILQTRDILFDWGVPPQGCPPFGGQLWGETYFGALHPQNAKQAKIPPPAVGGGGLKAPGGAP